MATQISPANIPAIIAAQIPNTGMKFFVQLKEVVFSVSAQWTKLYPENRLIEYPNELTTKHLLIEYLFIKYP